MGLRFPNQINCACFFVTTTFKDHSRLGEVDGFYEALSDSLAFYTTNYNASLAAYVFMPTHLHLLLFISGRELPGFMRDFKKFIAQKVARDLGIKESQIWMPRYDRVAVESERVFRTKLDYIHQNPVKAGLVEVPESWQWSSAADYVLDRQGLVPIWRGWR